MKKLGYFAFALTVFAGAAALSGTPLIDEARADCTSIWATCSESDVNELDRELSSDE